jgi:formate--tetrahydrofolate ligase
VQCVSSDVFEKGGRGGIALAKAVLASVQEKEPVYAYDLGLSIRKKIEAVAKKVYGAESIVYTPDANRQIKTWEELGYSGLPVCIAKTQFSFSDDPKKKGAVSGFEFQIREVRLSAGAGFVVPISGELMTMPGMPPEPNAQKIDLDENNQIIGM